MDMVAMGDDGTARQRAVFPKAVATVKQTTDPSHMEIHFIANLLRF